MRRDCDKLTDRCFQSDRMTLQSRPIFDQQLLFRRDVLIAAAALGVTEMSAAQGITKPAANNASGKLGKPMTAAEESAAAKAVADSVALETGEPAHPAVGNTLRLPATFKLFNGQNFSEARTKGKLLLVFYWASWCPICKVVEPRLQEFWMQVRGKGVEVLALSTDAEVQPAFAHIQKAGLTYPASMAAVAKMSERMTPRSLPTMFVRSKLGIIVNADEGEIDIEDLKGYLAHL